MNRDAEEHLIALVYGKLTEGNDRWIFRLLQRQMIELTYTDTVSHEAIYTIFKKNEIKPWLKEEWCIPPQDNAEFICNLEGILEVYKRSSDPKRLQVCTDDTSKHLLADHQESLPIKPGYSERFD